MTTDLLQLQGTPFDFIVAFFAGLLMSFTPCVYPLIPITVGYIGAKGASSRFKGFQLSTIYVLGIAVTYSCLGLIASLTGRLFGFVVPGYITNFAIANVCIIAGLFVLEVFRLPAPLIIKSPLEKRKGFLGAFIMGVFSAFAISPCVSPVLGGILSIVATRKSILFGMSLLFIFAYGAGATLIIAGTFSGVLAAFPRSGKWLEIIKKIYGIILIVAGEYFLIESGKGLL